MVTSETTPWRSSFQRNGTCSVAFLLPCQEWVHFGRGWSRDSTQSAMPFHQHMPSLDRLLGELALDPDSTFETEFGAKAA